LAFVSCLLALSACGEHVEPSAGATLPSDIATSPSSHAQPHTVDGAEVSVGISGPSSVASTAEATFTIAIKNNGVEPLDLELGGPGYYTAVLDSDGSVVWVDPAPVQAVLRPITIQPGRDHRLELTWNLDNVRGDSVDAGSYIVAGGIRLADANLASNAVSVQVTAG
jgi:hypothetical protein